MSTRFSTALVKGDDSFAVGRKAAQDAMAKLSGHRVDLCLLFGSIGYDLPGVIKGIRSVIGGAAPLIGSTSSGEFTEQAVDKKSIAVGLISSDAYRFEVKAATGLKEDVRGTFDRLKKELNGFLQGPGVGSFMMMIDGLAGNGEEATLAALTMFESDLHLVGGAAGDELAFKETKVIANDQILSNAVALCAVKGPHPFFVTAVKHGHQPLSKSLAVTKAKGNVLFEVNGRPAWDVWVEETRKKAKEVGIDVDHLSDPSAIGTFLIRFELGLETAQGDYKIRVPLSKNPDGSLNFACIIPEGVQFRIMQSVKQEQIDSARTTAELAGRAMGNRKAAGALIFDCVCRAIILGPEFSEAVKAMKDVLGDIPILGLETYGEICMDPSSFSGFHNTTSVVALIPK